jgi:hypothetical protein
VNIACGADRIYSKLIMPVSDRQLTNVYG